MKLTVDDELPPVVSHHHHHLLNQRGKETHMLHKKHLQRAHQHVSGREEEAGQDGDQERLITMENYREIDSTMDFSNPSQLYAF